MRKFLFVLILLPALLRAEFSYTTSVGTNSACISPARVAYSETSIGAVLAQGDVVGSGGNMYMALEAGTVTNLPLHVSGESDLSGVALRYYPAYFDGVKARTLLWLDNQGTNQVWLTVGQGPAVSGVGLRLDPGDRLWVEGADAVHGVSESGVSPIVSQEVY